MFARYAAFLLRRRAWITGFALAVTAFMLTSLLPLDKIRFDFSFRRLFRFDGEETRLLTKFKDRFGDDASTTGVLYVVKEKNSRRAAALSPATAVAMAEIEEWMNGRYEFDREFTISPLSATDFYDEEQVRPEALGLQLAEVLDGSPNLVEVEKLWRTAGNFDDGALSRYGAAAERLMRHDIYSGMVLAADGGAAAVMTRFKMSHLHPATRAEAVAGLQELVDRQQAEFGERVELHLVGIPAITTEYTQLSIKDIAFTTPASMLLISLFLFLLFRSWSGLLLPQLVVLIAVVWNLGLMQMTDEPLNIINHIAPVIVLVVGVADAVHILSRYLEERSVGLTRTAAVQRSVETLGKACFLTSATTAVGFASLSTATIATVASFGTYTAIAVMFTYVVNMTLLPVGLSLVGPDARKKGAFHGRLDRSLERLGRFTIRYPLQIFVAAALFSVGGVGYAVTSLGVDNLLLEEVPPTNRVHKATKAMETHLRPVIPHEILFEGRTYPELVCDNDAQCGEGRVCVKTARVRKAMAPLRDAMAQLLPPEKMRSVDIIEQRLELGLSTSAGMCAESIKDPRLLQAIDKATISMLSHPFVKEHVGRMESLVSIVKQMHLAMKKGDPKADRVPDSRAAVSQLLVPLESSSQSLLDRFATLYYDAARLSIYMRDHGSSAWDDVRGVVERELDEAIVADPDLGKRFTYSVTGTMTFVEKALSFIVHDMLTSLFTAFFFIFFLMVVLFRSLRIAMLSVLPNIFPLLTTLVLMSAAGIALRTSTIIIFSISLGIAVNDTIHFIARYNEEMEAGRSRQEAILTSLRFTGRAMIVTTIILVAGFMIDLVCEFVALQQFGYLASFTMVMALVGDLIVLPSCLMLFGKKAVSSEQET